MLAGACGLLLTLFGLVIGATEFALALQRVRIAAGLAPLLFAVAGAGAYLSRSALRGSWRATGDQRQRRITVRVLLAWALLVQVATLAGLATFGPPAGVSWRSVVVLVTCFGLTLAGLLTLNRRPRAALTFLGITAAYSTFTIGRIFWFAARWSTPYPGYGPVLSYLLVLSMGVALILSFVAAWPLRDRAPEATAT